MSDPGEGRPGMLPARLRARLGGYSEALWRDGAVHVPQALDEANMMVARRLFDFSYAHPGAASQSMEDDGEGHAFFIDTHNPSVRDHYRDLLAESSLAAVAAAVLGVDRLWFLGEQIFIKNGREYSRGTPWHQDTDLPIDRRGAFAIWIPFDRLDAGASLQFVRGSHMGPAYNPFVPSPDGGAPTLLYPDAAHMPPFPDVEADPRGFELVSWACEPGDIVLFHNLMIHGGAPVPPGGMRRALCLRFFGPELVFEPLPPRQITGNLAAEATGFLWEGLEPGMPLRRGRHFFQVHGPPQGAGATD